MKLAKLPKKCQNALCWHTLNVPERCGADAIHPKPQKYCHLPDQRLGTLARPSSPPQLTTAQLHTTSATPLHIPQTAKTAFLGHLSATQSCAGGGTPPPPLPGPSTRPNQVATALYPPVHEPDGKMLPVVTPEGAPLIDSICGLCYTTHIISGGEHPPSLTALAGGACEACWHQQGSGCGSMLLI